MAAEQHLVNPLLLVKVKHLGQLRLVMQELVEDLLIQLLLIHLCLLLRRLLHKQKARQRQVVYFQYDSSSYSFTYNNRRHIEIA